MTLLWMILVVGLSPGRMAIGYHVHYTGNNMDLSLGKKGKTLWYLKMPNPGR
jgi:hypothetical protein